VTSRLPVALGVFFGLGFLAGFLMGFGYASVKPVVVAEQTPQAAPQAAFSADKEEPVTAKEEEKREEEENETGVADGELALTEHEMGDDESGIYIAGTVVNRAESAFDAAQIAFELCDSGGKPFTTVTDRTTERMEPGDSWGFVVYIPYADLPSFDSYRLQGIMGVRK